MCSFWWVLLRSTFFCHSIDVKRQPGAAFLQHLTFWDFIFLICKKTNVSWIQMFSGHDWMIWIFIHGIKKLLQMSLIFLFCWCTYHGHCGLFVWLTSLERLPLSQLSHVPQRMRACTTFSTKIRMLYTFSLVCSGKKTMSWSQMSGECRSPWGVEAYFNNSPS